MADIFTGAICTFYKDIISRPVKKQPTLTYAGKNVKILDLLTNERYTNGVLLNSLRNSGYKSDYYLSKKQYLSAACFSSVQDDLTIDRSENNHLFHTGFLTFDIDTDGNPSLLQAGMCDEMKDFIIDNIPYIAYLGKSVSNLGLWGLIPISNKDDHYGHYAAVIRMFDSYGIVLDKKTFDPTRLRFLSYDPDAHFELNPKIFEDTYTEENTTTSTISEYERPNVTDDLFIAACKWIEAKHEIKFEKGSIHNYLLYLYGTLRHCHVPRYKILNWIYNNLIDESQITTNCLDEVQIRRYRSAV